MIMAAAERVWIDGDKAMVESLIGFRRAGAHVFRGGGGGDAAQGVTPAEGSDGSSYASTRSRADIQGLAYVVAATDGAACSDFASAGRVN